MGATNANDAPSQEEDVARLRSELQFLFLAFPMVFKGRVVQYVGRVLRAAPGKRTVEVLDYLDTDVPVLARAHQKRLVAYASLGFPAPVPAG